MISLPNDRRAWWSIAKRVFSQIDESRLSLISAGIAFFGLLALFPALTAIILLWGLIGDPGRLLPQLEQFRSVLPSDVFDILSAQITSLAQADSGALGWSTLLSLALALWSTRAGVTALIGGMNAVYAESNRTGLWQYLTALTLTLALVVVALVAIAATVLVPVILAFVPLGPVTTLAIEVSRWLLAGGVLFVGAGMIYRYGPNRRGARLPWITPGAMMAVLLWAVASWGFSLYLTNFGTYDDVYGPLAAVVVMLMWLFVSGFLLLLGGALNAELERHSRPDSTIGPERPAGQRGAEAADTVIDPNQVPQTDTIVSKS